MANRNWASGGKVYTMHVSPVILDTTITIGATGAVASITQTGIKSVTRVSTGIYQINLQDSYNGLIAVMARAVSTPSALSGISAIEVANGQNTTVQSLTAPSVTIKTLNPAGALADPASGSQITAAIMLSNSSVKVSGNGET